MTPSAIACFLGLSVLFGAYEKAEQRIVPACSNVEQCGYVGELTGWRYQRGGVYGWGQDGDVDLIRDIKTRSKAAKDAACKTVQ